MALKNIFSTALATWIAAVVIACGSGGNGISEDAMPSPDVMVPEVIPEPTDDSDGDGLQNRYENWDPNGDGMPSDAQDTDGDGIPDYLDADDDGDLVPTANEGADPNDNAEPEDAQDTDDDGMPDYLDMDDDGDGINTKDEDTNGNGDSTDDDENGNGVPNYLEEAR